MRLWVLWFIICPLSFFSDGREQLEFQGVIHDKITVCATDESYQTTRQRMSQVEKESWSHSAIEIKPGATHQSENRLVSLWNKGWGKEEPTFVFEVTLTMETAITHKTRTEIQEDLWK